MAIITQSHRSCYKQGTVLGVSPSGRYIQYHHPYFTDEEIEDKEDFAVTQPINGRAQT